MRTSTPMTAAIANFPKICAPTIPVVDWRPIRGSLGAFRAGYEEIEQFVSQLLDEIDAAWRELDAERTRQPEARGDVRAATDEGICGIVPIEARAGTVLLQPLSAPEVRDGTALERRIAELEEDRYALQAEVEFARNRFAEQAKQMEDERRRAAEERATWANELRLLREAIHQQMTALNSMPPTPTSRTAGDGASAADARSHAANDPVLGPLLTQFKILQRDAARRRET